MEAKLLEENGEKFSIKLELSKEEVLNFSGSDLKLLHGEIRRLCRADELEEEAKKAEALKKTQEEALREPFAAQNYKNVKIENGAGSRETVTARLIDKIIEDNDFYIPPELEEEIEYEYTGILQSMKYQRLFGESSISDAEIDRDEVRRNVEAEVIREYKERLLLKSIIEQEKIECTAEELKAEAEAMAERDNCTLEFVQKFMGDDFGMLKNDLLKRKARELIYETADLGR